MSALKTATYSADVCWTGEHWGQLSCGNGPSLPFSAPPDAHGHEDTLTPEDTFVGAVNMCVMLMFLWACERFKVPLLSYECSGEGTKVIDLDHTESFVRVVLKPRITARGADTERKRIERALQSAQKYSLIARSVTSELVVEPEITMVA